jgi:hypothetical protein
VIGRLKQKLNDDGLVANDKRSICWPPVQQDATLQLSPSKQTLVSLAKQTADDQAVRQ